MSSVDTSTFIRTPLSEVKDKLNQAKYDATSLIKVQLETIDHITNGKAAMLDPTHPAVTLLEMSACMAANNQQESVALLRRMYPVLATTEEELYLHMSDTDYINRFATPSRAKITFAVLYSDVMTKMPYSAADKAYKATIPRDSRFTVDNVTFMMPHSVDIRRYETGAIQISYDSSIESPFYDLRGIVITPTIRYSPKQVEWIFFEIDVIQLSYSKTIFPLDKTYLFRRSIPYTHDFYYARVYIANDLSNNEWVEIKTTHTDQVFDSNEPTALLKVLNGELQVEIPVIYFSTGHMSGSLRVDIFTTRGALTIDLARYQESEFTVDLTPLDEARDISEYTSVLADISYYVFGRSASYGGKNSVTLEDLRKRVIYHAVGPQNIPITNVQVEVNGENYGFEIVKEVDVLTNRKFLATRKLPAPKNPKLITPANIGMVTYADLLDNIVNNEHVIRHHERYTIKSNAIFQNNNGRIKLLRQHEVEAIQAMGKVNMVSHVNGNEYFYTPFYYVLDETLPEFDLRAYMLDQPKASDLSFERQNQTAQLYVNTSLYYIEKVAVGYRLVIQTNSGAYYKELQDGMVGVQLAFLPYGESTYAYINGRQIGRTSGSNNQSEGERIFEFIIETNHECNEFDQLAVLNSQVSGITDYKAWISLTTEFLILHYTGDVPQTFIPDETTQILGKFLLDPIMVGNSMEKIVLKFGDALINLWRRNHSYELDTVYQKHEVDIPMVYERDVFDIHPDGTIFDLVNGEIVYRYLHRVGDPVLDEENRPVYKYRAGDVILDEDQEPIKTSQASTGRELDILVVDGRYIFADDEATVEYRSEIASTLALWITGDIAKIQESLLEQTDIYFYPKTTLGHIKIYIENNEQDFITAEQSFKVALYVKFAIYNDPVIRQALENATISLLDDYIANNTINMTEVRDKLKILYGDSVQAFKISGLGGAMDYEVVSMASNKNKLCLKKVLTIQPDMKMFVRDAVEFEFKLVN